MLGDLFTKPLQGTLFARMREKILNLPSYTGTTGHSSVLDKQDYDANENKELKYSDVQKSRVRTYGTEKTLTGL